MPRFTSEFGKLPVGLKSPPTNIKYMVQSSPRNLIVRVCGWIQLGEAEPPLINFELIQFTRNEASQLGQSVYVVTRESCEQFQEKELSHRCSILEFLLMQLLLSIKNFTSRQD